MNFFHLKRPYSRCRILVFRLRYRYRTAKAFTVAEQLSPKRSFFNRTIGAFTMPQAFSPQLNKLLSPKLRFFHRVKDAFTSSSAAKGSQ
jgi:hypothetical protein